MAVAIQLRQQIIKARERHGFTYAELAELYGVGEATVSRLLRQHREQGHVEPKPPGRGRPTILDGEDRRLLQSLVEAHADWTTYELAEAYNDRAKKKISRATAYRELKELGFTVKKRPSWPKSAKRIASSNGEPDSKKRSKRSSLHVWYFWTKRVRT